MKRRRFIKTSVRAGFAGFGFALSTPHDVFARFKHQEANSLFQIQKSRRK